MRGPMFGDCSLRYLRMTLKKLAPGELGLSCRFYVVVGEEAAKGVDRVKGYSYPC